MRTAYWFFATGIGALGLVLIWQRIFFMWIGLAALVIGSLLPSGREDSASGDAAGGGDEGGGD